MSDGEPKIAGRDIIPAFFTMKYRVYILKSATTGKLYVGQTSDLETRIKRHNAEESGSRRYTHKQRGPWRLIHSEIYQTRAEAMTRERFLKSGKGREWIKANILKQPANPAT